MGSQTSPPPPTARLLASCLRVCLCPGLRYGGCFSVLTTLKGLPYEPMASATLLQLSIKLTFLLAVATSRHRSELHSLTTEPGHIRWEPGGVRLIPATGFLTNNQSDTFLPPDIFVPDIKSHSSVRKDKLWCPVRALKWYVSRTEPLRNHLQLFVTSTPPHVPASRDTITRWLVTAIRSVAKVPTSERVNAHEIRATSTSWAFFKGVSLSDITQAACWKTPNTFTDCYLRDVVQTQGRAGRTVLAAASRASTQPGTSHQ
jgi:hypothetical protein